jgi:hypothetical protein
MAPTTTTTMAPTTTTFMDQQLQRWLQQYPLRLPITTTTMAPTTTTMRLKTTPEMYSKFIIRIGGTNWRQLIENGDISNTNAQREIDIYQVLFTDVTPENEIAKQFRYFAEYNLRRTGSNEGSIGVYTFGPTYQGKYTFRKAYRGYYGIYNGYDWYW